MPALAIYKDRTYRLLWLGRPRKEPGVPQVTGKRAKIAPLHGGVSIWVDGSEITLVDNKVKEAGK